MTYIFVISYTYFSPSLKKATPEPLSTETSTSSSSTLPSPPQSPSPIAPPPKDTQRAYAPYTDDPEASYSSTEMLQMQREVMDDQDVQLDRLSRSISRQRDLSLQINDELDVHTGLLEGLDHDLDRSDSRLRGARRSLERVAAGAKANSRDPFALSTYGQG